MTMNASAQSLVALITGANLRFVIPVYQRPYSWDEEQCLQLWDDVRSVGENKEDRHFTGSVVWVQDGVMDASGITPLLLIDGQQRMTTLALMIAALADYSRSHPGRQLTFSHREITSRGYLIDEFRTGESRYKLTLSQGDRETLASLLENLIDQDAKIVKSSPRIIDNYNLFRRKIEAMENPSVIWNGIQRLDVVSISLDAGKDNPQLIFESMNSTGKDLSSTDLIRNYVLMGLPRAEQEKLYANHWRAIEDSLGANSYETLFDNFMRDYLRCLYAPRHVNKREVYSSFKKHVIENGYNKNGRITDLLKQLEANASYYSCITSGKEPNAQLRRSLDNIAALQADMANPLLLFLYNKYADGHLPIEDFIRIANLIESYILRRGVAGVPANSLESAFSKIIVTLNSLQEGDSYLDSFEACLALEAGTTRRFPTNEEFSNALLTRDCYHFRRCFFLLRELERMHHPKDSWELDQSIYTIEHVMPQNALAHAEWRDALSQDEENEFESICNNLGNLTLTAYNSELSDGTFEEKQARIVGGYDKECLVISKPIAEASTWTPAAIASRCKMLAKDALDRWPFPSIDVQKAASLCQSETTPSTNRQFTLRSLTKNGLLKEGEVLLSAIDGVDARATVSDKGLIQLQNGEEFSSPSAAANRVVELSGQSIGTKSGWKFWKTEGGETLAEIRSAHLKAYATASRPEFLSEWWSGFFEFCAEVPGFAEAFGSPYSRASKIGSAASFGVGDSRVSLTALVGRRDHYCGVELYFNNRDAYEKFFVHKDELNAGIFSSLQPNLLWNSLDEDKKSRTVSIKYQADFEEESWETLYGKIAQTLLIMRAGFQSVIQ